MINVGLIGCGHISETYFRSREYFNNINITACSDINIEAAKKCANEYNIISKNVDSRRFENDWNEPRKNFEPRRKFKDTAAVFGYSFIRIQLAVYRTYAGLIWTSRRTDF